MRLTIILADNTVIINERIFGNLDLSALDPTLSAVQGYDTEGEEEFLDDTIPNNVITSLVSYQDIIDQAAAQAAIEDAPISEADQIGLAKKVKYNQTYPEYVNKFEQHTGLSYKGPDWEFAKYAKNLHRKVDGIASPTQIQLLIIVDHLREKLEELQDYILDPVRTLQEVQDVDVSDIVWWPAP